MEVIQHSPNLAVLETGCFIGKHIFGHIFKKFVEDVIQGYKVDEIRRIFVICCGNTFYYFIGHFLKNLFVIPYFIEISYKCLSQRLVFYDCCADNITFFATEFNCRKIVDWCITGVVNDKLPLNSLIAYI